MKIWIDADGCPRDVKEVVLKASERRKVAVVLVANRDLKIPSSPLVTKLVVAHGVDVADERIVELVAAEDLVITGDVPLAAAVVAKGAVALGPRGELYTEENVRERLSVRDMMQELRSTGVLHGGPRGYSDVDKRRFADAFDRTLTQRLRAQPR